MNIQRLALLVGGGPAPGINAVIAAATHEARREGLDVIGIYDGYRDIAAGHTPKLVSLDVDDAEAIHATGGSFLRTSRTNPAKDAASLANCVRELRACDVRYLIAIGGDDTTTGACEIAQAARGHIGVATVPKTIDNDLPLPDDAPTFGFETARSVGAGIVESLLVDARTTSRWYLVVTMGRKSGALALGIGKAANATLAIIPEEFHTAELDLQRVVDLIVGAIIKRRVSGYLDGVAVVAEGIIERISAQQLQELDNVSRDAYGHVRFADIPLGTLLRDAIRRRLAQIGVDATVLTKDLGYELRCANPVAFDIDYARTLGYGAVRYLLGGGSGALIALRAGRVTPLPLEALLNPATGHISTRSVDISTEAYHVARRYMTRIEAEDLRTPRIQALAAHTNLDPPAFAKMFASLAEERAW